MQLTQRTGRGSGAALPGLISERLDPQLGRKLAAQLQHGVILVTGTNGKTTTTKLLAAALEAAGERVLTNRTGSNLRRGILSSLIAASSLRGRMSYTIGLFEVDEASLRQVVPLVDPRLIVVLNLFRDQLDRYGELDRTALMIGEGITASRADIVLNADDPLVASLARYANPSQGVSYFGIEGLSADQATGDRSAADSNRCPICGTNLEFNRVFYAHIGHYRCPHRDFSRPQPQIAMTHLEEASREGSRFEVSVLGKRHPVALALPGVYNISNALAAIAATQALEMLPQTVIPAIEVAEAAFGRTETIELQGHTLYLLLIKNPTGFNQIIETFLAKEKDYSLLLAINDNFADGRDVSWLWDANLERLVAGRPRVVAAGLRATDMALRLKYAGAEQPAVIEPELDTALAKLIDATPAGQTIYILPTYTALLQIRELLARQTHVAKVSQL